MSYTHFPVSKLLLSETVGACDGPVTRARGRLRIFEEDPALIKCIDAVDRVRARRIETLVEVVRPDRPWIVEPHRAADVPQSRNGGRLEAGPAIRLVLDDEAALAAGLPRPPAGRAPYQNGTAGVGGRG